MRRGVIFTAKKGGMCGRERRKAWEGADGHGYSRLSTLVVLRLLAGRSRGRSAELRPSQAGDVSTLVRPRLTDVSTLVVRLHGSDDGLRAKEALFELRESSMTGSGTAAALDEDSLMI